MPFSSAIYAASYGIAWSWEKPIVYCQNNTSASDYGKCHTVVGKAIFVQTDTTTWPINPSTGSDSFPCAADGTCTRYTATVEVRSFGTVFSYSGKQAIVQYFWSRSHAWGNQFSENIMFSRYGMLIPTHTGHPDNLFFLPSPSYEVSSWPVYDPVVNFKL